MWTVSGAFTLHQNRFVIQIRCFAGDEVSFVFSGSVFNIAMSS